MLSCINRFPLLPESVTSSPLDDLCSFSSSQFDSCPPHESRLIFSWSDCLNRLEDDTLRRATTSNSTQSTSSDPPTASLGSDLWASSSSSSVWEEFLFSSFLAAMSLGCCPPALKKTLPALLLSSLLPALPHISSSEPFCLKHLAPTGSSTYRRFRRDLTLLFADWGWNNPKHCSQQGPDMFEQLEVHFMLIPQTLLLGSLFMKHKSTQIRVFTVFAPLLKHQTSSHTHFLLQGHWSKVVTRDNRS